MGRNEDEYVTYTIVMCQESATSPADVATMKIKRFRGGSSKDWLTWSMQFRSLAKRKGWRAEQLSVQLLTLIDGDLLREVERIASDASSKGLTFEDFYREVGLLLVPEEVSSWMKNYGHSPSAEKRRYNAARHGYDSLHRCTPSCPRMRKPSQRFNNVAISAAPCRRTGRTSSRAAEFRMRR